ncbi:MAG TPA: DNA polymerase III subunit beta [bacterium]|nr:DNA polymerase III subunit beta [bacterium]
MEIRVERETFLKGLGKVLGVVERKSTMPILSNTLLEATADEVRLTGTDLDVGTVTSYPAEVSKGGRVAVDARKLHDIVKEIAEARISLKKLDNNWLEVSAGKAKFKITGLSPDEFPNLPDIGSAKFAPVPAKVLAEMLDKTSFSVSTDETRYNMSGVYVEKVTEGKKPGLRMVSTDTHRLSKIEKPLDKAPDLPAGVILPRKGVAEMRKLAEEAGDGAVELGFAAGNAVARSGKTTVVMRLIEGQFPPYSSVLPKGNTRILSVDRGRFAASLRRISVLSSERIKGVKLELSKSGLVLSASNPEFGEAREEVEADFNGDTLEIGFNAKYLLDVLSVLAEEVVELALADDSSPGLLKAKGNDDFLYVIMPMRI